MICNGSGCFILIYWQVLSCRLPLHPARLTQSWPDGLAWGHSISRFQYLEVSRMMCESGQKGEGEGNGDTQRQKGAHKKVTEPPRTPYCGPSLYRHLPSAYVSIPEGVRPQGIGVMWTCKRTEWERLWMNTQKSRTSFSNPSTVYHFSVLRARFWKSYC